MRAYLINKKDILTLIQIFNGNIITKYKINQFKSWIEGFNKVYKTDINCLVGCDILQQHQLNLDNALLSGFTDAEGCFTSSVLTSKVTGKTIVTVRYVVSQKDDIEFSKNLTVLPTK